MSMNTKRELLQRIRREYSSADRQRKSELLNSLIEATGYNRKYAISLLSKEPIARVSQRRTRKCNYGSDVIDAVRLLWQAANGICAKRLMPFLPTLVDTLERCGNMKLGKPIKEKILKMSVSTLERILKKERDKELKGKSLTRPGSVLKKQIAVKTYAEWNDRKIGFLEVDLVAHCGGDISGRFLQTLTMTDIATGWTEILPIIYKADVHVRAGLEEVVDLLPFKIKGIDCDNGSEFLNHKMVAWCKARKITFTRSRAYRKNDQAHVEEKNGSVVRRLVGYERFVGRQSCEIMKDLYLVSRLYINYFQPSMKLIKKTRIGAKVKRQYDTAKTPLERLLAFETISKDKKDHLVREFRRLNPLALLAEMAKLQAKLWQSTALDAKLPVLESANETINLAQTDEKKIRYNIRAGNDLAANKAAMKYSRPKRADRRENRKNNVLGRIDITEDFVDNAVQAASGKQIIHRDSTLIGFGLRVTAGSKSFVVEARAGGKVRRITVGSADLMSVEEARNRAVMLLWQLTKGIAPPASERKK